VGENTHASPSRHFYVSPPPPGEASRLLESHTDDVDGRRLLETHEEIIQRLLVHKLCCEFRQFLAIPLTGREGPYHCETSKLPHFLDSRLADGGEVVSLTRRPLFTPRKIPVLSF
jgi:hypothetical protein